MTGAARSRSYASRPRGHAGAALIRRPAPQRPDLPDESYVFNDVDHAAALFTSRRGLHLYAPGQPTVTASRSGWQSGGRQPAVAAASGHSAHCFAFFTLMGPATSSCLELPVRRSITQFTHTFPRLGWHGTFVDPRNLDEVRAAIGPRTRLIFTRAWPTPRRGCGLERWPPSPRGRHPLVVDTRSQP